MHPDSVIMSRQKCLSDILKSQKLNRGVRVKVNLFSTFNMPDLFIHLFIYLVVCLFVCLFVYSYCCSAVGLM